MPSYLESLAAAAPTSLVDSFETINHTYPMLSLGNTYSEDDLIDFDNRIKILMGKTLNEKQFKEFILLKDKDLRTKIIDQFIQNRNERIKMLDEEKAKEMLPSLEELVNDSVDDNVLLRASELRRSLQNMDDFIRESLPTVQQILDEALDVKAQIQKLRADAKHLQNIEDARNSAYLKKTGGKDGLKKKKQRKKKWRK